ncbi:hypothetical protein ACH5RR_023201 [Cinchona calisaya]|uniref:Uncharacterized protein n=1 Tax=Cinchona calisaya TaxID=153742 RepID=A0ABD2Z9Z3_9GENT
MKVFYLNRIDDKYLEVEHGKKMREGCEFNSIPDSELIDGNMKTSTFGNGYENISKYGYMKKGMQSFIGDTSEDKCESHAFKMIGQQSGSLFIGQSIRMSARVRNIKPTESVNCGQGQTKASVTKHLGAAKKVPQQERT